MMYEVEFELGDGDKSKETGIMIDIVTKVSGNVLGSNAESFAVIVMGDHKIVERPLNEIEVVDEEVCAKFKAILAKHEKLGLPVDIVGESDHGVGYKDATK